MKLRKLVARLNLGKYSTAEHSTINKLIIRGCIIWMVIHAALIIQNMLYNRDGFYIVQLTIISLILTSVVFLHTKQMYILIRWIVLTLAWYECYLFARHLGAASFLEFYFLLIPIVALILFDHLIISIVVLFVSHACFVYIPSSGNLYPWMEFRPLTRLGLFCAVYIAYAYFKILNFKSEKDLQEQRNKAIETTKKIERQRKELEQRSVEVENTTKKIEQQRIELESMNKFQSQFWYNLTQEITPPLTIIKNNTGVLLHENTLAINDQNNIHQSINTHIDNMKGVLDDIMDLAKIKAGKLLLDTKKTDFLSLFHQLTSSLDSLIEQKQVTCVVENKSNYAHLYIEADHFYLMRALIHLIKYAIDTSQPGQQLFVKMDMLESKKLVFSVKDENLEIPKADLPFIFDPFYKIQFQGGNAKTGIRLAFTKEILQLHKATIEVKSTDKGSLFECMFQVIECIKEPHSTQEKLLTMYALRKNTNILTVDENLNMRTYLKELLNSYQTHEATSGNEALEIIDKIKPQLIITDDMIPEMDGYKWILTLRKKGINIPVIVLSMQNDEERKVNFLRLGIDDYLIKPFDADELIIRVENRLNNYQEQLRFTENYTENKDVSLNKFSINDIRDYIQANLHVTDFRLLDLANELSISERTLHRKIKQWCGLTPLELIREVKLEKAALLLRNASVNSIKELAIACGFTNTSHFIQLYEKRYGKKPQLSRYS